MLELEWRGDYVSVDVGAWIDDRTDTHDEAQEAFDTYAEARGDQYVGESIAPWLASLGGVETVDDYGDTNVTAAPSGLYGEDGPWHVFSGNGDNYLSDEVSVTLAHTDQYGSLLLVQQGYYSGASVDVYAFIGDDDADAVGWSSGYAGHADGSDCDSEWIVESACKLWPNGGRSPSGSGTFSLWELETRNDMPVCPDHGVPMTLWTS